jgi:hypothetical protein
MCNITFAVRARGKGKEGKGKEGGKLKEDDDETDRDNVRVCKRKSVMRAAFIESRFRLQQIGTLAMHT